MDREQDSGCTDSALKQPVQRTTKPGTAHASEDDVRWAHEHHSQRGGLKLRDKGWELVSTEPVEIGRVQQSGQQPVDSCSNDHQTEPQQVDPQLRVHIGVFN